ncbi:MAG: type IX secretion system outer membrane channel protein PorV [Flavobacteriales bacterium]|nr:MAG: type IX secretion system outer membrane channel protein PorV [Flavobacteriales bacterium]
MKFIGFSIIGLLLGHLAFSQTVINGKNSNPVLTAVPFLNISPDARSGAMGDAGVALSPSTFDTYWNPSKMAFLDEENHASLSYTPWLRNIAPDVNMAYLNFARRINERTALGASINYFNQGRVTAYDVNEVYLGAYQPNEFAIDFSVARKLSSAFSMGVTAKYIYSNIIGSSAAIAGAAGHSASALAAGVSLYYVSGMQQFGREGKLSFGAHISDIGTKINYYDSGKNYFLPTNLKVGVADEFKIDELSKLTLTLDLNKLLVPTPPLQAANGAITAGRDDDSQSIVSGIFGSFGDAPGGASEEFKEISYAAGGEYKYDEKFAIRAGYFYENQYKGNRRYATFGAGYRYENLVLDFSYLIAADRGNPLNNTIRFTLSANFGKKRY